MGQRDLDQTQTQVLSHAYREALLLTGLDDGTPEAAALVSKVVHLFMAGERDHKRIGRQAAAIRIDLAHVLGFPEVPDHVIELVRRVTPCHVGAPASNEPTAENRS